MSERLEVRADKASEEVSDEASLAERIIGAVISPFLWGVAGYCFAPEPYKLKAGLITAATIGLYGSLFCLTQEDS